jgi:hypothetical protein
MPQNKLPYQEAQARQETSVWQTPTLNMTKMQEQKNPSYQMK